MDDTEITVVEEMSCYGYTLERGQCKMIGYADGSSGLACMDQRASVETVYVEVTGSSLDYDSGYTACFGWGNTCESKRAGDPCLCEGGSFQSGLRKIVDFGNGEVRDVEEDGSGPF